MFIIDQISLPDLRLKPQRYKALAEYYWDHYAHFAHERSNILEILKESLSRNCTLYPFSGWQRAITFKYSLDPLSTKGSISNPGGRFNIGEIDKTKFPQFSSLYIAEDRGTAFKEKFGQYDEKAKQNDGLTASDLALNDQDSISILAINGRVSVLDLNNTSLLNDFFNLIKAIKLPRNFINRAKTLNIHPMFQVKNINQLKKTILDPNWRYFPMQFDVPANSQIFGQIAFEAGVEAILYPSKMSSHKNCMAIFPKNLSYSSSYIELAGNIDIVENRRMDAETYLKFM